MHFAVVAIVSAAFAALTTAAPLQTRSTYFPFQPEGACVSNCTMTVGKNMYFFYTEDETSPFFIQSLSLTFERGTPQTIAFMTAAGECMTPCPTAELDLYRAQYPGKLAWYKANK